jgi:predicted Zn-dependent peptidase
MKYLLLLAFLPLLLSAQPAAKKQQPPFQEFRLDNGLRVIVIHDRKMSGVHYRFFTQLPVAPEENLVGYEELTAVMQAIGPASKAMWDEQVAHWGALFTAGPDGIMAVCQARYREQMMAFMADMVLRPAFDPVDFEQLKIRRLAKLNTEINTPATVAANVAAVLAFGKTHPYGELPTPQTIRNIELKHCRTYYHAFYRPEMSCLVIMGDVRLPDARKLVESHFSNWQQGGILTQSFELPPLPRSTQIAYVALPDADTAAVRMAYPVQLRPGDPDFWKTLLLNTVLLQRLNDKAGKFATDFQVRITPDREMALFVAAAKVPSRHSDSLVGLLLNEIEVLRREPLSEAAFRQAVQELTGSWKSNWGDPHRVGHFAIDVARYRLPADFFHRWREQISKTTPQQLHAAARKYLPEEQAHIVVAGQREDAAALTRFDGDGRVVFYDVYGTPIDDNNLLMPEGLDAKGIIEGYIQALGGQERLASVSDLTLHMSAQVQGQEVKMAMQKKAPGKALVVSSVQGNVLTKIAFDGAQAAVYAMGEKQALDDQATASIQRQAWLFPEIEYLRSGSLSFGGLEDVNGRKAWRVDVVTQKGYACSEYYDVETALKLRSVTIEAGMRVVNNYSDYREVQGVLFPFEILTTFAGELQPPMLMRVSEAKLNTGLSDSIFIIR